MAVSKIIKGMASAVLAAAAAISALALPAAAYEIKNHTQQEIRDMYEAMYFDIHSPTGYVEDYSLSDPYAAGKLDSATLEEARNSINFSRYLAGLPYDIELTEEYNEKAQYSSLVTDLNITTGNDGLSHTPKQPVGLPDDMYAIGYDASGKSNIAYGFLSIPSSVIGGYMDDTDSYNISRLGHRRWILNPDMMYAGVGKVGVGTAMYVRDKSRPSVTDQYFTGDYIAWPPTNMPFELMSDNDYSNTGYAYSVTLGDDYDDPDRNNVKVTVTSKLLGETYTFDKNSSSSTGTLIGYFGVENSLYGTSKCIIFNPGALPENDVVSVNITGIYKSGVESPIRYKVNYFDLLDESDYDLGYPVKTLNVQVGETVYLNAYNNPLQDGPYGLWYYTNGWQNYASIQASGCAFAVTGIAEGSFTVSTGRTDISNGWDTKTKVTINVTHAHESDVWIVDKEPTEYSAGSRHKVCLHCGETFAEEILPPTSMKAAEIEVPLSSYIYDGYAIRPQIRVLAGGVRLNEGVDYTVSYSENNAIGEGEITVTGIGYFHDTKTVNFDILPHEPVDIYLCEINLRSKKSTYSGRAFTPKVNVVYDGTTLVSGVDYELSYSNNINAGTGSVTITGINLFYGDYTDYFTIEPADIGSPFKNNIPNQYYTGSPIRPDLTIYSPVNGTQLVKDTDYTVDYVNNVNVGVATVTVTGINNYSGSDSKTFNIIAPPESSSSAPDDSSSSQAPEDSSSSQAPDSSSSSQAPDESSSSQAPDSSSSSQAPDESSSSQAPDSSSSSQAPDESSSSQGPDDSSSQPEDPTPKPVKTKVKPVTTFDMSTLIVYFKPEDGEGVMAELENDAFEAELLPGKYTAWVTGAGYVATPYEITVDKDGNVEGTVGGTYILGDINRDGLRAMDDVAMLISFISGTISMNYNQKVSANIDASANIDYLDISMLISAIAGDYTITAVGRIPV